MGSNSNNSETDSDTNGSQIRTRSRTSGIRSLCHGARKATTPLKARPLTRNHNRLLRTLPARNKMRNRPLQVKKGQKRSSNPSTKRLLLRPSDTSETPTRGSAFVSRLQVEPNKTAPTASDRSPAPDRNSFPLSPTATALPRNSNGSRRARENVQTSDIPSQTLVAPRTSGPGQSPSNQSAGNAANETFPTPLPIPVESNDARSLSNHPNDAIPVFIPAQTTPSVALVETIEKILTNSKRRVLKQFVSQQRNILSRLTTSDDAVGEIAQSISSLKAEVTDLKKMLLSTCSGTPSQRGGSRATGNRQRNKTKILTLQNEVLHENPNLMAELNIVFNTDTSCIATAKAIAHQLKKFNSRTESVSTTSRVMNAMLYGLLKDMPKASWKEGIGFRHAELRFRILKIMLQTAKSLSESLFTLDEVEVSQMHNSQSDGPKPIWLTSDIVKTSDLILARKQHECVKSELPSDPSDPAKRQSLFIAKCFMKVVIDMLRQSREKSRVRLFEDGGCCLLDWESFDWFPSDLTNPTISFLFPESEPTEVLCVPDCVVGKVDDVREHNANLAHTLIAERSEMNVECLYDVHITNRTASNGRRKRVSSERKSLRRLVNIIRMSSSFLCGFCHVNEDKLLSTHPAMLKCIYRFALVIRQMFAEKMNMTPNNGADSDHDIEGFLADQIDAGSRARGNTSRVRKETPRITIQGLLPSDSEVLRTLQNTVTLTPETFENINVLIDGNGAQREGEIKNQNLLPMNTRFPRARTVTSLICC